LILGSFFIGVYVDASEALLHLYCIDQESYNDDEEHSIGKRNHPDLHETILTYKEKIEKI